MQITLTDAQYELLRGESHISGSQIAELVRRSIDDSYGPGRATHETRLAGARAARGIWSGRGDDVFAAWREMRGDRIERGD